MTKHTPAHKLSPLITHEHWELLLEYVADEKLRLVTQLLNCNDMLKVKELQGQHKALCNLENQRASLKQEMNAKR